MKGRNAQVSRIYMILNILEGTPQGLSVGDITNRLNERAFEVTKRTVYRDLEALRAAGFPLDEKGSTDENATRWALERHAKVGQYLVLESRELLALYLARNALSPLRESPFFVDLESLFNKIENKLGNKAQEHLDEIQAEIRFESGQSWGLGTDSSVIEILRASCSERHKLKVTYASANSQTLRDRIIGPHYLYFSRGSLYLVGEDLEDTKVKVFAVPRMQNAEMLIEEYTGAIVDPEELFQSSFGIFHGGKTFAIRLCFSAIVAPYIKERRWHKTQQISPLEDGGIELSLDAALTPELIQWVLGFGAQVTVIEPLDLTVKLCEEADNFLRRHRKRS